MEFSHHIQIMFQLHLIKKNGSDHIAFLDINNKELIQNLIIEYLQKSNKELVVKKLRLYEKNKIIGNFAVINYNPINNINNDVDHKKIHESIDLLDRLLGEWNQTKDVVTLKNVFNLLVKNKSLLDANNDFKPILLKKINELKSNPDYKDMCDYYLTMLFPDQSKSNVQVSNVEPHANNLQLKKNNSNNKANVVSEILKLLSDCEKTQGSQNKVKVLNKIFSLVVENQYILDYTRFKATIFDKLTELKRDHPEYADVCDYDYYLQTLFP